MRKNEGKLRPRGLRRRAATFVEYVTLVAMALAVMAASRNSAIASAARANGAAFRARRSTHECNDQRGARTHAQRNDRP